MMLDLNAMDARSAYALLTACVVPRPIAWVSTADRDGHPNLAPFSFFNGVAASPPSLSLSIMHGPAADGRKDTLRNILQTGVFAVNIAGSTLAPALNESATDYPAEVDEFVVAGVSPIPCTTIAAPRVAEAPICFECRLLTTLTVGVGAGGATLVVGAVTQLHVRDDLLDERQHLDLGQLDPIARLAGGEYARLGERFSLARGHYDPAAGAAITQSK